MFENAVHRFHASFAGTMIVRGLHYAPDFSGRATRTELAIVCGISITCGTVLGLATMFVHALAPLNAVYLSSLAAVPIAGAVVRRLHDVNRRASAVVVLFMPYIGIVILGGLLCLNG
jgi:uncharacterized membrane protein YhaH (DUF805 family)